MLARYEPTIRATVESQLVKKEDITEETGRFITKSEHMTFGLAMADTGHLMYRWDGGWFQWVPYKALRVFVRVWNKILCLVRGHDTFGPIIDEGHLVAKKTCMHCSKTWETDWMGK